MIEELAKAAVFLFCSVLQDGIAAMPEDIKIFAEGLRKGLCIVLRCGCGKTARFQASDFCDVIGAAENIEDRRWRCSWCGARASSVRFTPLDRNDREGLAQWRERDFE